MTGIWTRRLAILNNSFLTERVFNAKFVTTFSGLYQQVKVVPQWSILLVNLFNIKINGISKCPDARNLLFVYYLICYRSKIPIQSSAKSQKYPNKFNKSVMENGFSKIKNCEDILPAAKTADNSWRFSYS